jgi:RHS repeat-associated protein
VETGLDYFGARYLSSAQGRWTSPDWSAAPEPVPYASLGDPQTLNLYAYVRNNPLSRADLDGHKMDCSGANAQKIGCLTIANWNAEHGIGQAGSVSSGRRTTVIRVNGSMEMRHGNIAFRDNNPGNLRPGPFTEDHGQIGVDVTKESGPFAVFEDSVTGEAALRALLATRRVQGRSILEEMAKFAPKKDRNDPVAYARMLADALHVDVNAPMSSLTPAQVDVFVEKVKQKEGFYDANGSTVRLSGTARLVE